jgi:hypothetical protein
MKPERVDEVKRSLNTKKQFCVNAEGVHLIGFAEYTMCGCALEGDPDNDLEETHPTKSRVVTCPRCIDVIETCRGVRTRRDSNEVAE